MMVGRSLWSAFFQTYRKPCHQIIVMRKYIQKYEDGYPSSAFLLLKNYFYFYVYGCFICMHVCAHVHALPQPQESIRSLVLKLQMTMSCYVGASNLTQPLWKSNQCSQSLSHLFSPVFILSLFIPLSLLIYPFFHSFIHYVL